MKKAQREQIASLAHDLKTPLTVMQGNIDLLDETELDEEQKLYLSYAMSSSEQMKQYIKIFGLIYLKHLLAINYKWKM